MHERFPLLLKAPDMGDRAKAVIESPWGVLEVHSLPSAPQGLIPQIKSLQVLTPPSQPGFYSGLNPKWFLQYLDWIPALTPHTPWSNLWHPIPPSQLFADPNLDSLRFNLDPPNSLVLVLSPRS